MPDRKLHVLLRLRQMELDAARHGLGAHLAREASLRHRHDALAVEARQAALPDNPVLAAMGTKWLDHARALQADLADQISTAADDTQSARAAMGQARAAVETVQTLLDQRAATRAEHAARQEQHTLDDIARGMERAAR